MSEVSSLQFETTMLFSHQDFNILYFYELDYQNKEAHIHDFYVVIVLFEGSLELTLEDQTHILGPGDMAILPPGTVHRFMKKNPANISGFISHIGQDYLQGILEYSSEHMFSLRHAVSTHQYLYHLDFLTFNSLQGKIYSLLEEVGENRYGRDTKIILAVHDITVSIDRSVYETIHKRKKRNSISTYEAIVEYIDSHLNENLSLDMLAQEFFTSKYHIAHLFQKRAGISVHRFIVKKRLAACCDAMKGGFNATDIYLKYGFKDYSGFYRAFHNEFGISPKEYTKQL